VTTVKPRSRRGLRAGALVAAVALTALASPAFAAQGSIDHVQNVKGKVQVLYSLPDGAAAPDLSTLKMTLDGKPLKSSAALASNATNAVRRTAILAVDVSDSMNNNGKFTAAKQAAQLFLNSAPKDLYVGIVTFAGKVSVVQQPSLDRTQSQNLINGLKLSYGTYLYDGLQQAVRTAGTDGLRDIIVLSDGRDTSKTPRATALAAVKKAQVKVDVVALNQSAQDKALLTPLSDAGGGSVISANDPKAVAGVFEAEARSLAKQIQVTASVPPGHTEGSLAVSVDAGGTSYTDSAFVSLTSSSSPAVGSPSAPTNTNLKVAPKSFEVTPNMMLGGVAAMGVGVLVIVIGVVAGVGKPKRTLEDQIDAYTSAGRGKRVAASSSASSQSMRAQVVDIADKALKSSSSFEARLNNRLEAAAVALKPPEWLLLHGGIAVGAAVVVFALSGGSIALAMLGLVAGVFLPWMFLGMKRSRRLKAFNSQLAGCLQLMAGSLKAGLSLAQALDTVVREGQEPLSGEFRRALVETRLGVPIEDALESIGERMESADFGWTVMAIRIQREVGGNLAELLLSVAATLRERDYLRRQVKALSAEGRFSAYILLALPPGVMAYMMTVNPKYLSPLIHTPMGFVMIGVMVTLMALGFFMMKKMIKVEV
jgi:tight adherence protein B